MVKVKKTIVNFLLEDDRREPVSGGVFLQIVFNSLYNKCAYNTHILLIILSC